MLRRMLASLWRGRQPASGTTVSPDARVPDATWYERDAAQHVARGEFERAAGIYRQGIAAHPDHPALRVNASNVLKRLGRITEARAELETATDIAPDLAGAWYNLGLLLHESGYLDEAADRLAHVQALYEHKDAAEADSGMLRQAALLLGLTLQKAGRALEAREHLEATARRHPALARDCLQVALYSWLLDPDARPDQLLAAHRAWSERFTGGAVPPPPPRTLDPGQPLRVGYLSGDLRSHAVSLFIEPVLEHHDRDGFEIFLYDNSDFSDAATARLSRKATRRQVAGLSDAELAGQIRGDAIDILVDLSGHTARNRLGALALRPTPVSIAWLGYRATTGLSAMDWRLTDRHVDPPGRAEAWHSERLLYLPASQWCFALSDAPLPGPLPAAATGRITFGSFNQFERIHPGAIALWARLLLQLPGTRLLMAGIPTGGARDRLVRTWARHGIPPERLLIHGYVPRTRFLELHDEVDIALDVFPCNGGTTTCESLARGVPVVTIAGEHAISRAGLSLLAAAGFPHWVADDVDSYVRIASDLTRDLGALAELRATLPARLRESALGDARTFTRDLEAAFRQAWSDCLHRHRDSGISS